MLAASLAQAGLFLGQGQPGNSTTLSAVTWAAALIVCALGGGVVILLLRGRLLAKDAGGGAGGTLEDLRRMRDSGRLSAEEFDAARASLIRGISRSGPGIVSTQSPRPSAPPGAVVAPPGFDLTGAPLPKVAAPGKANGSRKPDTTG